MSAQLLYSFLSRREATDPGGDEGEPIDPGQEEIFSSWALFIVATLLILSLFMSYFLQLRKIQAVHETVVSIFAGMLVGLIVRVTPGDYIQSLFKFNYQFFFNLLLPPIILNSGYELHQANFFRNIGTILTFAFAGTFISAVVLGVILFLWSFVPFESNISFVEAISVGATLSATDPVTILAIFTSYKVDPKLYTIIFGESILNDAVAIVMFETASRFRGGSFGVVSLFKGISTFLIIFLISLFIGVFIGIGTALLLKHTYIRRFPKIESCLVLLVAYVSYLFSNGCHMSGIVSLLFCGITLKHYAYYNMSRRTQLTTKYLFQVLSQLAENFIFIYLGLTLFADTDLDFQPVLIIVTTLGICAARWLAVFPLSKLINAIVAYRGKQNRLPARQLDPGEKEIPDAYQVMLFWAGLRGAVGVALAAGLQGEHKRKLRATVLVVVVLTVIVFGGTTARMLEIMGIRTGVVEEIDSDDEFDTMDLDPNRRAGGIGSHHYKNSGGPIVNPRDLALDEAAVRRAERNGSASSSSWQNVDRRPSPTNGGRAARASSLPNAKDRERAELLGANPPSDDDLTDLAYVSGDEVDDDGDLPPPATRPNRSVSPLNRGQASASPAFPGISRGSGTSTPQRTGPQGAREIAAGAISTASTALNSLLHGSAEDGAEWFRQIDEGFIKPHLLLPQGKGGGSQDRDPGAV